MNNYTFTEWTQEITGKQKGDLYTIEVEKCSDFVWGISGIDIVQGNRVTICRAVKIII